LSTGVRGTEYWVLSTYSVLCTEYPGTKHALHSFDRLWVLRTQYPVVRRAQPHVAHGAGRFSKKACSPARHSSDKRGAALA